MFVGEVKILPTGRIQRIAVGNGKMFTTSVLNNNELLLIGEAAGDSSLVIWSDNNRKTVYTIRVSPRDAGDAYRNVTAMLQDIPGSERVTVGGDKGFDTAEFVRECRNMRVTPHVAQNLARRGGSAIDGRTTQHESYRTSQKKRKRIEECFGWLKTIALLRKMRHRGTLKVDWMFTFACAAYNLVRMRNLMAATVPAE